MQEDRFASAAEIIQALVQEGLDNDVIHSLLDGCRTKVKQDVNGYPFITYSLIDLNTLKGQYYEQV
jgi:hypothetical protein